MRHVALDNGIQFGGLFSERLITDALRGVGVKASRCNYARVYLNGKPAGVYVISDGDVRWVPSVDTNRLAVVGMITALVALVILRSIVRSVVRR